jgi:hypothetical protein
VKLAGGYLHLGHRQPESGRTSAGGPGSGLSPYHEGTGSPEPIHPSVPPHRITAKRVRMLAHPHVADVRSASTWMFTVCLNGKGRVPQVGWTLNTAIFTHAIAMTSSAGDTPPSGRRISSSTRG